MKYRYLKEFSTYKEEVIEDSVLADPVVEYEEEDEIVECEDLSVEDIINLNSGMLKEKILEAVHVLDIESELNYLSSDKMRSYKIEQTYGKIHFYNFEDYQFADKYVDVVLDIRTNELIGKVQMKKEERELGMVNKFRNMFRKEEVQSDVIEVVETYCDIVRVIDQLEGRVQV
jgi:hypothetical protein